MIYEKHQYEPLDTFLTYGQMNIIVNFRDLWRDLATWTKNYMVSLLSGWGGLEQVGARLYEIPLEFYYRLQLVFGAQVTQELVNLLSQHIILMLTLFTAVKANDVEAANSNTALLYSNASILAQYLEAINPFWSELQWKNLLDQYIRMTIDELTALITNQYQRDISIFDSIIFHTVYLGDYMANGLLQYLEFKPGA